MAEKFSQRRKRREKEWIYDELNSFTKTFLKLVEEKLDAIVKSETPYANFIEVRPEIENAFNDVNNKWRKRCNNIKTNNKKILIPYIHIFEQRANYLLAHFILVDCLKLRKSVLVKYFPEELFDKEESLLEIVEGIICEELAKKEKSKIKYTELPKRSFFSMILSQVSYYASLVGNLLKSKKRINMKIAQS